MNRRRHATAAITMICALTVLASPALTLQAAAAPLPPPPPKKSLEEVRKEIDTLYRQAAVATDAYNLAEEKAKEQSAEIVRVAVMIVEGREKIEALKAKAGATARAQYRNGGLPDGAQLVLTNDPQLFLDNAGRLKAGAKATTDLLGEMTRTQAQLDVYSWAPPRRWPPSPCSSRPSRRPNRMPWPHAPGRVTRTARLSACPRSACPLAA
ncbi:coiled-coil domain-containing protein [Streptomyces massasporeus]